MAGLGVGFDRFFSGFFSGFLSGGGSPGVRARVEGSEEAEPNRGNVELDSVASPSGPGLDEGVDAAARGLPARTPVDRRRGLPTRFEDFELEEGEERPFVPHETLEAMFEGMQFARDWGGAPRTPLDPIVGGNASVHIELMDREGSPLASRISLWKVDAPESLTWTAGSQRQQVVEVPIEGLSIDGLAAGTYRVQVDECARNEDDPTAFEVREGARQRVVLRTLTPIDRPFHLRLFRMDGTRVERAHLARRRRGSNRRNHPSPPWATPREPRVTTDLFRGGGFGGSRTTGGIGSPEEIVAGEKGLPLGEFTQGTRRREPRWEVRLTLPTEGLRTPSLNGIDVDGSTELAALAVDVSHILERVHLADGRTGDSAGVVVTVAPQVLDAEHLQDVAAWQACTVEITARAEGFVTRNVSWCPANGPLPELFLDYEVLEATPQAESSK